MKKVKAPSTKPSFAKQVYTIDYILQNPSSVVKGKGLKVVWQAAVTAYFSEQGMDLTDPKTFKKPIADINFAQIVKNFNKLIGKKAKASKKKPA